MNDLYCPTCRFRQPAQHTYCISCGTELPSHLLGTPALKSARFFAGIKVGSNDPEAGFLRVSCYVRDQIIESPDGSVLIPGNHVRFSMWVDDRAKCVMSLPASEAREMAAFVLRQTTPTESSEKSDAAPPFTRYYRR